MDGQIKPSPFSKEVDMNIDDLETILKIHFLMPIRDKPELEDKLDVIEFMKELQDRIRKIKTTIRKEKERFQGGEIKGKIDFESTLKERLTNGSLDETVFICNLIDKNYNTDENQVLKTLLLTLQSILKSDKIKEVLKKDYLKKYWKEKKIIKGVETSYENILDKMLENNIYLRRISVDEEKVLKDERKLRRVAKSRNNLYSEAAELLIRYKKIMIDRDLDSTEAQELLRNTFIIPKKMDVFFELYWTIKIVKEYKKQSESFELKPIAEFTEKNIVAGWEYEDYIYEIYYRVGMGADLDFSFRKKVKNIIEGLESCNVKINGTNLFDTFIGRELKIIKHFDKMGDEMERLWGGSQPDIVLKKIDKSTDNLEEIFIWEVKYTEKKNYAKDGMKELLEYISLVGLDDKAYTEKSENLFEELEKVKGALFVKEHTEVGNITDTKSEHIKIIHHNNDEEWESLKMMLDLT